ncbi:MAG: hypothetical protein MPJ50_12935 [Pirellulales bacterium]|nr:hypothetical protein [Pirellulales bacterium]
MQPVQNNPAFLPGFICGLIFAVTVVTLIGGLILRLSVSWFNKMRGASGRGMPSLPPEDAPREDAPIELAQPPLPGENPYAAPSAMNYAPPRTQGKEYAGRGAPVPGYGKAMGIVFLRVIIDRAIRFFVYTVLLPQPVPAQPMNAAGPTPDVILPIIIDSLADGIAISAALTVLSFLIGALILKAMLPASLGKACVIQLLEYLIGLAILLVLGVLIVVLISVLA